MKAIALFITVFLAHQQLSNAFFPRGVPLARRCFGQICPNSTVLCQRLQYTTQNSTMLTTEVDCMDDTLTTVNSFNNSRPNPFGPDWSFQGLTVANPVLVPANSTSTTETSTTESTTVTPPPS